MIGPSCGEVWVELVPTPRPPPVHTLRGVGLEYRQMGFMGPWQVRLTTGEEASCDCGKMTLTREWAS